jgi:hypothetical protein
MLAHFLEICVTVPYNSNMRHQDAAVSSVSNSLQKKTGITYRIRKPPHHSLLKPAEATFTHLMASSSFNPSKCAFVCFVFVIYEEICRLYVQPTNRFSDNWCWQKQSRNARDLRRLMREYVGGSEAK